jgi:TRAP transporter TAXI family solute receptor
MTQRDQRNKARTFLKLPKIPKISWRDLAVTLLPTVLIGLLAILLAVRFVQPAPPHTITISSGPAGSTFQSIAERYQKILARNGIQLKIQPSEGSLENLNRLLDPNSHVDIGFVQGGVAANRDVSDVVSLGSLFYETLAIVYRSPQAMQRLSELKGKRIAIGPEGSGTRFLALALLKANGIEPGGPTTLVDLGGSQATDALLKHEIDAAFLMGDSAPVAAIRQMLHTNGIRLFDFPQADAYARRFRYLNKLQLPPGAFDLGANLPPKPLVLMAPTVELIAKKGLHPALSDLLIEAAKEVHGRATLFQAARQFPSPEQHEFLISTDAERYYKAGKSFAYRYLPFWLASLVDRLLVVVLPTLLLLIPSLRFVPNLYGWRVRSRIYRRYGELMSLERKSLDPISAEERAALLERLDRIERSTITGKTPGAFADEIYVLRQHIKFVRERLAGFKEAN